MGLDKSTAQRYAYQEREKAKNFHREADKKRQQAKQKRDEAAKETSNIRSKLIGATFGLAGSFAQQHHAKHHIEEAERLEREAADFERKASESERLAAHYDNDAAIAQN